MSQKWFVPTLKVSICAQVISKSLEKGALTEPSCSGKDCFRSRTRGTSMIELCSIPLAGDLVSISLVKLLKALRVELA